LPINLRFVTPAEYAGTFLPDLATDDIYAAPNFEQLTRLAAAFSLIEIFYDRSLGLDGMDHEERQLVLAQCVQWCQRFDLQGSFSLSDKVRDAIAYAEQRVRQGVQRINPASLPFDDFARAYERRPMCDGCGAGSPCIGAREHDRPTVNHEPRCLRVPRDAFLRAIRATEGMYGAYAPWCNRTLAATMHCWEGARAGLNGATKHHANGTIALGAQIELELPIANATVEKYPALEWVLLHEVAVHGVQAAARDRLPGKAGHCAFTEGLVDRTVGRLYVTKYMEAANPPMPPALVRDVHSTIDAIEAMRIHGGCGLHNEPGAENGPMKRGYAAYRSLERLLTHEEIFTLVLSLNLELSTTPEAGERDRFLEQVELDAGDVALKLGFRSADADESRQMKRSKYLSALKYLKGRNPIRASTLSSRLKPAIAALLAAPPISAPKAVPLHPTLVSRPESNPEPAGALLDDGCPH
jgi:hypothetical protein